MTRTPGKLGRRAPKRAAALKLSDYLTGVVPAHPANADYLEQLSGGWDMLGNDTAGDCVAVTWANIRRLVTWLSGTVTYPTQDQVWKVYQTQNPGFSPTGGTASGPGSAQDNGMDIQTLLEYLVTVGGPDGVKALGFASVDHTNPEELEAAVALFGYVWTGINVLAVNMDQFNENEPWAYSSASAVDGGHSVVTGGYGAPGAGSLGGDERFITWAAETSFTDSFWQHEVEETWVVIWPEHLGSRSFLQGIDLAQLAADYTAITGRPFPATVTPVPAPIPVPPAPSPVPVPPETVVQELIEGVEKFLKWLRSLV
jgi:hypothetical protein